MFYKVQLTERKLPEKYEKILEVNDVLRHFLRGRNCAGIRSQHQINPGIIG